MTSHKTVFDDDFKIEGTDHLYDDPYGLTTKLDEFINPFDQQVLNEIVLWKVNRYVFISDHSLELLNKIDANSIVIDIDLTIEILKKLLQTKGIQLPMASTILRFKNKNIYQIIDQRVYRIINKDKKLKLKTYLSVKNLSDQINLYLSYLTDLRKICGEHNIPFDKADRILYAADRRINKAIPLDNYSKKAD